MLRRIRPSFAVLSLAVLTLVTLAVAPFALGAESPEPAARPDTAVAAAPVAPSDLPSLEGLLGETTPASCPIAKCDPALCPAGCVCRVVNCVIQCQPLPWDPNSCQ